METVRVLLYYDGSIEHGGQEGIHYNQPPRKCLKLSTGTRFAELVDQVHIVLTIPVQRYIIRLMWRSPTLHQKYVLLPIEDDDDVEHMLTFPSKFPEYRCIELYVLKDDVPVPCSVGHIENVYNNSPIAQQQQEQDRTPVDFPMIDGFLPAGQSDDVVNNQCNIDSRGMESDESADDDYWPEHDNSDEESNEDEESYGDDIDNETGFSSIPAYSHPEHIPTQVHDHQLGAIWIMCATKMMQKKKYSLVIDRGGEGSEREEEEEGRGRWGVSIRLRLPPSSLGTLDRNAGEKQGSACRRVGLEHWIGRPGSKKEEEGENVFYRSG